MQRGAYLARVAGCIGCHTAEDADAVPLAGGRRIDSAFGSFFSPNITADPGTGIGSWSNEEFVNAFREGIGPGGRYYYPAFPYPFYSGMTRADLLAIKAYLSSRPAVRRDNRRHQLPWYLDTRLAAAAWQLLKFDTGRFTGDAQRDEEWNRGAYLVRHVTHCGQCHTPRDRLGGLRDDRELAGVPAANGREAIPNITPHPDDGVGRWQKRELAEFLETGRSPSGKASEGPMADVIDDSTSHLTPGDRRAIAAYLLSLPPLADEAAK